VVSVADPIAPEVFEVHPEHFAPRGLGFNRRRPTVEDLTPHATEARKLVERLVAADRDDDDATTSALDSGAEAWRHEWRSNKQAFAELNETVRKTVERLATSDDEVTEQQFRELLVERLTYAELAEALLPTEAVRERLRDVIASLPDDMGNISIEVKSTSGRDPAVARGAATRQRAVVAKRGTGRRPRRPPRPSAG
jgi:hypothetical protein